MRTNFLVRSIDGSSNFIERVSPYLFNFRELNNRFFLPRERDLPESGLVLKAYTFDFGFNNPANVLTPYQEADASIVVRKNFLCWAVLGHRQVLTTNGVIPAEIVPPLLVNIYQQHKDVDGNSNIFQFFNKNIASANALGSARKPNLVKEPQLVLSNDSLQVDVQNTGNYNLAAQVVLYGGEFE